MQIRRPAYLSICFSLVGVTDVCIYMRPSQHHRNISGHARMQPDLFSYKLYSVIKIGFCDTDEHGCVSCMHAAEMIPR